MLDVYLNKSKINLKKLFIFSLYKSAHFGFFEGINFQVKAGLSNYKKKLINNSNYSSPISKKIYITKSVAFMCISSLSTFIKSVQSHKTEPSLSNLIKLANQPIRLGVLHSCNSDNGKSNPAFREFILTQFHQVPWLSPVLKAEQRVEFDPKDELKVKFYDSVASGRERNQGKELQSKCKGSGGLEYRVSITFN